MLRASPVGLTTLRRRARELVAVGGRWGEGEVRALGGGVGAGVEAVLGDAEAADAVGAGAAGELRRASSVSVPSGSTRPGLRRSSAAIATGRTAALAWPWPAPPTRTSVWLSTWLRP